MPYPFTQNEIYAIARAQSAIDCSCHADDFCKTEPVLVRSQPHPDARRYLKLPFSMALVSYGSNVVASVSPDVEALVQNYIHRNDSFYHLFETPQLHVVNDALQERGYRVCFMAEYFLPDLAALQPLPCAYEMRVLTPQDFAPLYTPQWSNALCKDRPHLDRIAVGAYDNGQLIALAGASADCDTMYQIGIDVLPAYRRQGIASALTSRLAIEILQLGKVPFYCAAWSNIASVRNAYRSGFRTAWVEVTAKSIETVEEFNKNA